MNDSKYIYKEIEIENVKSLIEQGYDVEVDSPDGYVKINRYIEKGPKQMYKITCNNKELFASYDHLFETEEGWILTINLDENKHKILCDDGVFHSFKIEFGEIEDVVDVEVENEKHRYYTNGLSSHNTNIGKTLIMCALTTNFVMHGYRVLYVTFEDSENKIATRIAQNMFDITQQQYKVMSRDDFAKAFTKAKSIAGGDKLVIKEYPEGTVNALQIEALIKDLKDKKKFVPDVLVVDYIGCMIPNGKPNPNLNSNSLLTLAAQQIRALGMKYGFPVISASQTNRGGYNTAEISLSDAADSFGQNMKADAVFAVTQTPEMKDQGMYNVQLLKTRYGNQRGQFVTIGVDVEKQRIFDLNSSASIAARTQNVVDNVTEIQSLGSNPFSSITGVTSPSASGKDLSSLNSVF